ncbi:MAG: hypothetical protein IH892_03805 [Planctomycetes bacterium]|nr:hypothetical protein [Planctomycetota bacterium]
MNRNLWLVLFGAISMVALMISHKAGRIYNDRHSEVSDLVILCADNLAEPIQAVSEAFMREHPQILVRSAVVAGDPIAGPLSEFDRRCDLWVSESGQAAGVGYSVVISPGAKNPLAARLWVDFLASPSARAVLSRHGLSSLTLSEVNGHGPDTERPREKRQ